MSIVANPFDLSGRVAVITGANTGLGQAIAAALAGAGASIVLGMLVILRIVKVEV